MTVTETAEELLKGAAAQGSVLGLSRIRALLERMGDPQEKLRIIHISGRTGLYFSLSSPSRGNIIHPW